MLYYLLKIINYLLWNFYTIWDMSAYAKNNIEDAYILINISLFLSLEVQVPSKYLKGKKK